MGDTDMSDTEIMKMPSDTQADVDNEYLSDSQVIAFKDAPQSVQRREQQQGNEVSVIGETLHFKGELSAGEDLVIEGKVEGIVNQGKCCLTLKPKGILLAKVNATKIFIEGRVEGDLSATVGVTIRKSGEVTGNIIAPKVAIDEGATFNGNIEMRAPNVETRK
jgi:cytoskeletal protein CcmA (bactofilin family)